MKTAFVTVGTTSHPRLLSHLSLVPTLQALRQQGFSRLVLQYGAGSVPHCLTDNARRLGIELQVFPYKDSIAEDIATADLVIGHAGAGTAIEVLRCHKVLVVVINDSLMSNHQTELAEALSDAGYLISCTPDQLAPTLSRLSSVRLCPFPEPNASRFRQILDQVLFPADVLHSQ